MCALMKHVEKLLRLLFVKKGPVCKKNLTVLEPNQEKNTHIFGHFFAKVRSSEKSVREKSLRTTTNRITRTLAATVEPPPAMNESHSLALLNSLALGLSTE